MNEMPVKQVDLTSCDREPIHKLGAIQPYGALLALTADWNVAFRSANIDEILGPRKSIAIGDLLSDHLPPDCFKLLREMAGLADARDTVERLFGLDLMESGRLFDCAVHRRSGYTILDLEPCQTQGGGHHVAALRPVMDRLSRLQETDALCQEAAREMRRLLGFDRVMVYRFHPDLSGEVIAEARDQRLESFLGLRYPKTDIPEQARRLYLKNLFRIIADVQAEPVPLEPATNLAGEPLDLSMSTLRAVSPIHIEYLRNMGVDASLSISIVVNGKLWGLFACHHYEPRLPAFAQRTAAELFSQLFSQTLELAILRAGNALREKAQGLHETLMTQLMGGSTLAENLPAIEEAIGGIIPHDGLSAYIEGEYRAHGAAPNEEEFLTLVPSLNTSSTSQLVHSESLGGLIPKAKAFSDRVVGALIIPVSRRPRDYIVLWRRELKQVVNWAGNPEKVAEYGPNGDRLTPRKSFAAWQESVEGKSAPWREEELGIAESLRVTLLEIILRLTDEAMQERSRAQERQELLIAELNHRVRNILTLIQGLIGQSRADAKSVSQFADIIGGRIRALAMAHDQITREQWSPASLHAMIRAEAEAYLNDKACRVILDGPDALIKPEAFTVLALVMHEMMTNSAKYGALCDSSGKLDIATGFTQHGDLSIAWRERGGPPVKAPTRRGFGSTIIEKSIPFELKGTADLRYEVAGVEADFIIPSRLVERGEENGHDSMSGADEMDGENAREVAEVAGKREYVLVVEDSMIIAMDAEDMLGRLGFRNVTVVGNVAMGLEALSKGAPLFAMLDFNLGEETSEPIARKLDELDVPYWFVTGYGEAMEKVEGTKARGILQKPYSSEDIDSIVASLSDEVE